MEFKSPLSQRIIISFVLLTTIVSGLFGLGISLAVHYVEESLITAELKRDFSHIVGEESHHGPPRHLDKSTKFYTGDQILPGYLKGLQPGFTEIVLDDHAYYVYMVEDGNESFYLVRDQTTFEEREKTLDMIVLGGFLLSIVISLALGLVMVNQVIAPVRRLTHQVRDREKLINGTPSLAGDYPDDEVGSLAKAFDTTIGMLQEALHRESLFTGDVSHELRTPLMVIKSSCDLLIEKDDLDGYSRQRIGMICKAADEIRELVEAFLTLARGHDTNLGTASLAAVVQAGLSEWEQLAAEQGLVFELHDDPEASNRATAGHPEILLRTVLNNLVRNAVHHTASGKIVLSLHADGFTLCDTGSGIASAEKSLVFQPYYRGTASKRNGMGLGLSLVQRICDREQWTIRLEDNQPHGCCFTVTLAR